MQAAAAANALVELRAISKRFGEGETRVDALRAVTLSVGAAEVVGRGHGTNAKTRRHAARSLWQ